MDELSEYLDPETIQWGSSSHDYTVAITGTDKPTLEFTFNNIDLPHSAVDELGSNGFVKFKVATKDDLPVGTVINNNANIYFDFNLAILTNTVQTEIFEFENLSVEDYIRDSISVYPNPTTGRIYIKAEGLLQAEIFDINGKLLKTSSEQEIDMSALSGGLYLIKIKTTKGIGIKKVILN